MSVIKHKNLRLFEKDVVQEEERIERDFLQRFKGHNKIVIFYDTNYINAKQVQDFLNSSYNMFPSFKIQKLLGKGSYGVVNQLCLDVTRQCNYVIKKVDLNESSIASFLNESSILIRLKDWDKTSKTVLCYIVRNGKKMHGYIVQEFINGRNLNSFINALVSKNDRFIPSIVPYYIQCYEILNELYTKFNIVHADSHLGNFIIKPDKTISIIDFGFAFSNKPSHYSARSSRINQLVQSKLKCYDLALFTVRSFSTIHIKEKEMRARVINEKEYIKSVKFSKYVDSLIKKDKSFWTKSTTITTWNKLKNIYFKTSEPYLSLMKMRTEIHDLYISHKHIFLQFLPQRFFDSMFETPYTILMDLYQSIFNSPISTTLKNSLQCMHKILPFVLISEAEAYSEIEQDSIDITLLDQIF